jgi:hypothetical protein
MKSRATIPQYAHEQSITLTKGQLGHIFPRGWKAHPVRECGSDSVTLARTQDGQWWAEWRGSMIAWASRWYEVPAIVGKRAQAIDQFVKDCV